MYTFRAVRHVPLGQAADGVHTVPMLCLLVALLMHNCSDYTEIIEATTSATVPTGTATNVQLTKFTAAFVVNSLYCCGSARVDSCQNYGQ